ncbi:mCG144487, partial [Mus musculus]
FSTCEAAAPSGRGHPGVLQVTAGLTSCGAPVEFLFLHDSLWGLDLTVSNVLQTCQSKKEPREPTGEADSSESKEEEPALSCPQSVDGAKGPLHLQGRGHRWHPSLFLSPTSAGLD